MCGGVGGQGGRRGKGEAARSPWWGWGRGARGEVGGGFGGEAGWGGVRQHGNMPRKKGGGLISFQTDCLAGNKSNRGEGTGSHCSRSVPPPPTHTHLCEPVHTRVEPPPHTPV